MFGNKEEKENKRSNSSGSRNHFADGTVISGEVRSEGDIRLEGKIIGMVQSSAKIAVGPTGSIEGDVKCKNADVEGSIKGTVHVDGLLHLRKGAVVEGEIVYNKLAVEEGAELLGNCSIMNRSAAKPLSKSNGEQQARPLKKEAV